MAEATAVTFKEFRARYNTEDACRRTPANAVPAGTRPP